MLLPYYCHKCTHVAEIGISWAGVQTMEFCGNCGEHIGYVNVDELPAAKEYRSEIWLISNGNAVAIIEAKKRCGFIELHTEKYRILQYNKLLRTFIQLINKND